MLAVATDYIAAQVLSQIVDKALGYPHSPQHWDGTALNQVRAYLDSVWIPYRGTTRQHDYIYYLSTADCWYPLSDATVAAVNASTYVTAGEKATVNAAAASRIDIGANPYAGGRTVKVTFVGGVIYWLGDSITQAVDTADEHWGGMRGELKNFCLANEWRVDMVGILATGNQLDDNENSGVGGNTCAQMNARVPTELGSAAGGVLGWNFVKLACLMAGTNDVLSGSTSVANYTTLLTTLHNALVANQPTARIVVTTIPPQRDNDVTPFNAGLPAVWNAFDAAHPANTLIRWDAYAALGSAWSGTYFYDGVHPNHAGYVQLVNAPSVGMASRCAGILAQIGAWPLPP